MVEVERNTHGIAVGGLTTGVIGTALGALNSGLIPGLFGGNAASCSENMGVNRYELSMVRELTNKDMEIAYVADVETKINNQTISLDDVAEFSEIADWSDMYVYVWNNLTEMIPLSDVFVCAF